GVHVAVVGDHDAWLERHHVVAVIPLLTLGLEVVAAGLYDAQFVQPQRVANNVEERLRILADFERAAVVDRVGAVASDLIDDFAEDRYDIAVAERKDRVEVHGSTALLYQASHDARGGFGSEERLAHLGDRLMRRAFAHADEYHAFADRHDIAALHGRASEILIRIAPPDLEVAALEGRVKLVDGALQERFRLAGRPVHRVAHDAPID